MRVPTLQDFENYFLCQGVGGGTRQKESRNCTLEC